MIVDKPDCLKDKELIKKVKDFFEIKRKNL